MGKKSNNEGFSMMDDFVCDAIPEPGVAGPETKKYGKNEGMAIAAGIEIKKKEVAEFPNTFPAFLEVILRQYPRPTPWIDLRESVNAQNPIVLRIPEQLTASYQKVQHAFKFGDKPTFISELVDLVINLSGEIRAEPSYHFDVFTTFTLLAAQAGFRWQDETVAREQFSQISENERDLFLEMAETLLVWKQA